MSTAANLSGVLLLSSAAAAAWRKRQEKFEALNCAKLIDL
jgi:hypothetical protein